MRLLTDSKDWAYCNGKLFVRLEGVSKFNKLYVNLFTTITSASNVNKSWQYIQSVFTFHLPFEYKEFTGIDAAYIDIPSNRAIFA